MSSATPPTEPQGPQGAPSGAVVLHSTTFQKNLSTGQWRAWCTCGWHYFGIHRDVQVRAACHDLDLGGAT